MIITGGNYKGRKVQAPDERITRPTLSKVRQGVFNTLYSLIGDFEGKTAEELSNDPRYQEWVDNGCLTPVPNGESIAQFKARCCKVFAEILERLPAESTTAFVIHGGCIMAILEAFAEPKRDFYSYHIPNGAYLRCIYQQGYLFIQGCDDGTKEQL
jgi:broad specificity phosphatase PhoE